MGNRLCEMCSTIIDPWLYDHIDNHLCGKCLDKKSRLKNTGTKITEIKKLLETLQTTEQAIYEYFGLDPQWQDLKFSNCTEYYWRFTEYAEIYYGDVLKEVTNENAYSAFQILDILIKKEKYTLIAMDTQTDGNRYFAIFDNNKEIK